jgi:hypothetical protein
VGGIYRRDRRLTHWLSMSRSQTTHARRCSGLFSGWRAKFSSRNPSSVPMRCKFRKSSVGVAIFSQKKKESAAGSTESLLYRK